MANAAWRALSDECEPLPRDGFQELPRSVQKAIARGDLTLEEALERARTGLDAELCPACGCRAIETERSGLCRVCHTRRLTDAALDRLTEVAALRDYNVAKTATKRARIAAGLPTPRGGTSK